MGGAWERLVQSVKSAMKDAYVEGKLSDEELQTLVVEAESIVDSRPLTYLPLDSEESEARHQITFFWERLVERNRVM